MIRVGFWEGISYLVLLLVAMPLKYLADLPMAVTVAGSIHGLLFIWFVAIIYVCFDSSFLTFRNTILAFLLSLIPFGTFFLKRALISKRE